MGRMGFRGGHAFESQVVSSRIITPSTHDISIRKPRGFDYLPVQFTFLTLMTEQGPDTRPMSLATSPTRPYLQYGVRISDSPYKRAFASLKPGDPVRVQGPFGDFVLDEERPSVFIAGGIGITPLKGMAEFAADKKLAAPIRLLYSNRTEDEIAYRTELDELERQNPRFKVLHTLTGENIPDDWTGLRGRISPDFLRKAAEGFDRPVYYLCGKPRMISAMFGLLKRIEVPEEDVRVEVFRGYWS
jgi:ferredoxin-NADP reductase